MLNHAELTKILYANLHDSEWNLHDDGTQLDKCKALATKILSNNGNPADPERDIDNFKSKYLRFQELPKFSIKTRFFCVFSTQEYCLLVGTVKWNSVSSCYCFFPERMEMALSPVILTDITEFTHLVMNDWRRKFKKNKTQ